MPALAKTTFVVVDIETTGSLPQQHAVTEIAAVKVKNGQVLDVWTTLLNPEQPIPIFIQRLTGITPDMVADAPTIERVLPDFLSFLGDAVFVAHNMTFDFRFLEAKAQQCGFAALENDTLCTLQLSRKLLPELKKRNLDALSQHFEIAIENRHRALGDAEATAQILLRFLEQLPEHDITTWGQLKKWQQKSKREALQMNIPFPAHRLSSYPKRPGIYFMRDERGEVLYVGKAKNLRARLQSYFRNPYKQSGKVRKLLQQVFDIDFKVLGSELEALLEEAKTVQELQPYFNQQLKPMWSLPFIKINTQQPYPQLDITTELASDGALYFGPFSQNQVFEEDTRTLAKAFQLRSCSDSDFKQHQAQNKSCLAYEVGTCSGPCIRAVTLNDYQESVHAIVQFLQGETQPVIAAMEARRDTLSNAMAYEQAQLVQTRLISLLRLQQATVRLQRAVQNHHVLIALPDVEPGRFVLLFVLHGKVFERCVFDVMLDSVEALWQRCQMAQQALALQAQKPLVVIEQSERDTVKIMAQWLTYNTPAPDEAVVDLTLPFETVQQQLQVFLNHVQRRLLTQAEVSGGR